MLNELEPTVEGESSSSESSLFWYYSRLALEATPLSHQRAPEQLVRAWLSLFLHVVRAPCANLVLFVAAYAILLLLVVLHVCVERRHYRRWRHILFAR